MTKIMQKYRGLGYFKDTDGLWKVMIDSQAFIVALDDSKTSGSRRIEPDRNNEDTCKAFIDWYLE